MAWQRRAGEAWRADLAGENHAARLEHGEAADERSDGLVGERCDCRGAVHVEAADDAWIGMVPEVADRAQQAQRGLQLGLKDGELPPADSCVGVKAGEGREAGEGQQRLQERRRR